jgi:DNA-directed RNA polymerase specialized sigma24 family protein
VERSEKSVRSGDDESAIASARYPSSAELLAAIHRGDEAAIGELFLRFATLLRDQARQMGVDPAERDEVVTTLLDDVVIHLMENQLAPRSLAKYLVAALRNRARNRYRDMNRRRSAEGAGYSELGMGGQRVVAECHSDYGIQASKSAEYEESLPLRSAISKLAKRSARDLTRDETIMLVGVGRHIPLREMAEQLGVTYGAARVRLHRLRERFRKLASQYIVTLKPDEKREIERFFLRAGVHLGQSASSITLQSVIERAPRSQVEKTNGQV